METIKVYRYLNLQHGLEALQTGEWKLGRLLELNDPFDCQPTLTNLPRQLGKANLDGFVRRYFEELNKVFGIICYSQHIHDPVLWSHYAESHKGFALGFEYTDYFPPSRVRYDNVRASLDYSKIQRVRNADEKEALKQIVSKGFLVKAKSWDHEKEWRHFIYLDAKDNKMVGKHYFRGIPEKEFKEVVLGARCELDVEDVQRITRSKWSHVQRQHKITVRKATMDSKSYRINI